MESCLVCERIEAIKKGTNINFICELETSYVVLGDSQYYKGYALLLSKTHCTELHHLENEIKTTYLKEMTEVAEAIATIFRPEKLNYELLGNKHAHLHWHLFPRYQNDKEPLNPIWAIREEERNHTFLDDQERKKIIHELKLEILKLNTINHI